MTDLTRQHDAIVAGAKGAARRAARHRSIGERSRALKSRHWGGKLARAAMAVFALLVAAMVAGMVLGGIGFEGVMLLGIAIVMTVGVLMAFPKMPAPTPAKLLRSDLATLAGKAEIWLEYQRPVLPAPAIPLVDSIGARLDALSPQLARVGEEDAIAHEARRLVGEHLPSLIDDYRRIPANLRTEARGGASPEAALLSGLRSIDAEIDDMARAIASGHIDRLATRSRYLEMRREGEGA